MCHRGPAQLGQRACRAGVGWVPLSQFQALTWFKPLPSVCATAELPGQALRGPSPHPQSCEAQGSASCPLWPHRCLCSGIISFFLHTISVKKTLLGQAQDGEIADIKASRSCTCRWSAGPGPISSRGRAADCSPPNGTAVHSHGQPSRPEGESSFAPFTAQEALRAATSPQEAGC